MANLSISTTGGKTPIFVTKSYVEQFFDESKGISAINIIVGSVAEQLQKINAFDADKDPLLLATETAFVNAINNKGVKTRSAVNSKISVTCVYGEKPEGYTFDIETYSTNVK